MNIHDEKAFKNVINSIPFEFFDSCCICNLLYIKLKSLLL